MRLEIINVFGSRGFVTETNTEKLLKSTIVSWENQAT